MQRTRNDSKFCPRVGLWFHILLGGHVNDIKVSRNVAEAAWRTVRNEEIKEQSLGPEGGEDIEDIYIDEGSWDKKEG